MSELLLAAGALAGLLYLAGRRNVPPPPDNVGHVPGTGKGRANQHPAPTHPSAGSEAWHSGDDREERHSAFLEAGIPTASKKENAANNPYRTPHDADRANAHDGEMINHVAPLLD